MIKYTSYEMGLDRVGDYKLPERIESMCFSYDGGRCSIWINDQEAFTTIMASKDFTIQITSKEI
jgi:hypothetical protein